MKFVDIVRRSDIDFMKHAINTHGVAWIVVQADDKIGIQTVLKEVEGSRIFNKKGNEAILMAGSMKNLFKKR